MEQKCLLEGVAMEQMNRVTI